MKTLVFVRRGEVHQIRLLHRFTNNIVLLYDGDAAGVHAALRGTNMLLEEEMNVKVLFLPDGNDPVTSLESSYFSKLLFSIIVRQI